jgi:hypothetical protein
MKQTFGRVPHLVAGDAGFCFARDFVMTVEVTPRADKRRSATVLTEAVHTPILDNVRPFPKSIRWHVTCVVNPQMLPV